MHAKWTPNGRQTDAKHMPILIFFEFLATKDHNLEKTIEEESAD
jgi:hypothetical protein